MADTNPISAIQKTCSVCKEPQDENRFILKRNVCKACSNEQKRVRYHNDSNVEGCNTCRICCESKDINDFIKNRNICKVCNNTNRKQRYNNDDEHRKCLIKQASSFKKKKSQEMHELQKLEQEKIGIENKTCRYCNEIKHCERFRHNRLKCKDCERDEPTEKFKRCVRTRIYNGLKRHKDKSTIEYLGCSTNDYRNWIMKYDERYTLENYGQVWHIDHVIPISKFDLDDPDEQLLAFNWRNTMPLLAKDNLTKNNKTNHMQIVSHYTLLKKYHTDNNILLPKKYYYLFATYLDAGTSLEP